MKPTIIAGVGVATVLAAGNLPIIPVAMQYQYSYQYPVSEAPLNTATGTVATARPGFKDIDGNGIISVAVFKDSNGNKVEVQIPDAKFDGMKGPGVANNPTADQYKSVFQSL